MASEHLPGASLEHAAPQAERSRARPLHKLQHVSGRLLIEPMRYQIGKLHAEGLLPDRTDSPFLHDRLKWCARVYDRQPAHQETHPLHDESPGRLERS